MKPIKKGDLARRLAVAGALEGYYTDGESFAPYCWLPEADAVLAALAELDSQAAPVGSGEWTLDQATELASEYGQRFKPGYGYSAYDMKTALDMGDLLTAEERKRVEDWKASTSPANYAHSALPIIDRLAPKPAPAVKTPGQTLCEAQGCGSWENADKSWYERAAAAVLAAHGAKP